MITFAVVLSLLKKGVCSLNNPGDMDSFYHHCNGGVSCEFEPYMLQLAFFPHGGYYDLVTP